MVITNITVYIGTNTGIGIQYPIDPRRSVHVSIDSSTEYPLDSRLYSQTHTITHACNAGRQYVPLKHVYGGL